MGGVSEIMEANCRKKTFKAFLSKWLFLAIISLCIPFAGVAQTEEPIDTDNNSSVDTASANVANVTVDGEILFVVRGSSALPAQERADKVIERLISAAELSEKADINIDIRKGEFGPSIYVDGVLVTITTSADAEHEEMEIELLAGLQAQAIEEAIKTYRSHRTDEGRSQSFKLALLWTVPFLLISYFLYWIRRHVVGGAERITVKWSTGIDAATKNVVQSSFLVSATKSLVRLILLGLFLFVLNYYLSVLLSAFAETRYISQNLVAYVTAPIVGILVSAISYVPNLLALAAIFIITKYIVKLSRRIFENIESGVFNISGFEKQWIWPTYNILRVFIWILSFIIALPYIPGSDSDAFRGVSILLGVMVSMGSNSVVGNLLAGLFVIYRRSTSIGDRIKVGEHIGDVVAIKLMETHLNSVKNELISIPNALLMNSDVINYTTHTNKNGLLVHTTVGIGYEEPQMKIERMLIDAAGRTNKLGKSPQPFVLRNALADYAVNYQLNAYTKHGSELPRIMSDLHSNILDVFNENQVQIMTPSYIADPAVPKIAPILNDE